MPTNKIVITSVGSISALGNDSISIYRNYLTEETLIKTKYIGKNRVLCSSIASAYYLQMELLKKENKYKHLDMGTCFQKSMQMAIQRINPNDIDIIVTHTSGTIKGDLAEYYAIEKIFGKNTPLITNNKWKIDHILGASGAFSIEYAILMLQNNDFINVPFLEKQYQTQNLNKILINAVGFGGNAVSILMGKA